MPCRCAKKTSEAAEKALIEARIALLSKTAIYADEKRMVALQRIVMTLSPLFKDEDVDQKMKAHPMFIEPEAR